MTMTSLAAECRVSPCSLLLVGISRVHRQRRASRRTRGRTPTDADARPLARAAAAAGAVARNAAGREARRPEVHRDCRTRHADFGHLGGAVYQIEMPDELERAAVLYMHGFEEFGPERVTAARLPALPDRARLRVGGVELQQHRPDPRPCRPTRPRRCGTTSRGSTDGPVDVRVGALDGRHGDAYRGRALREPSN